VVDLELGTPRRSWSRPVVGFELAKRPLEPCTTPRRVKTSGSPAGREPHTPHPRDQRPRRARLLGRAADRQPREKSTAALHGHATGKLSSSLAALRPAPRLPSDPVLRPEYESGDGCPGRAATGLRKGGQEGGRVSEDSRARPIAPPCAARDRRFRPQVDPPPRIVAWRVGPPSRPVPAQPRRGENGLTKPWRSIRSRLTFARTFARLS
jgi:hypothetical protein